MTTKKKFCRDLHQTYDTLARAAGKVYWGSVGYQVDDNPDQYGADLIVNTGHEEFYSEVEIKRVWSGPTFAYDTLQIPGRKKKFTELDKPCVFVVFNNEQTHAFACHSDVLKESPLVEVPNKYVYSGEMFYQIPITKLQYVVMPC
jgi:hypothetical protein